MANVNNFLENFQKIIAKLAFFQKNQAEKQRKSPKNQTDTQKCHRKYVKSAKKSDRKQYLVR